MPSIRDLNDAFRRGPWIGTRDRVVMTRGVAALEPERLARLFEAVRRFDAFDAGNDPYGEHDFGRIELDGEAFYFKIEYFDRTLSDGSEDPADPEVTTRIMTIMYADEY